MSQIPVYPLETPALRPLEMAPIQHQGRHLILVHDPMQVMEGVAALAPDPITMVLLQTADGTRTIDEIAGIAREATGMIITADRVRTAVEELDKALIFFSERFAAKWEERKEGWRKLEKRPFMTVDAKDRLKMLKDLGDEMRRHRMARQSPPERIDLPGGALRAVLSPHIDYSRGGEVYAWAYQALAERTRAKTYIILGTLHRPATHLFIATDKAYETPFGDLEVDKEMLDELKSLYDGELFEEEHQHRDEHTIELQAMYLKHAIRDRPFKILPILVGSFEDLLHMEGGPVKPTEIEEVAKFCAALKALLDRHGDDVVVIGGVDFAHCGREFGDEELNSEEVERAIREEDQEMLERIEAVDADGFFDTFRENLNDRKVCSISPIYCVLKALDGAHAGKTLQYKQANNPERTCMVSFASVAFTTKEAEKPKIILASR